MTISYSEEEWDEVVKHHQDHEIPCPDFEEVQLDIVTPDEQE